MKVLSVLFSITIPNFKKGELERKGQEKKQLRWELTFLSGIYIETSIVVNLKITPICSGILATMVVVNIMVYYVE